MILGAERPQSTCEIAGRGRVLASAGKLELKGDRKLKVALGATLGSRALSRCSWQGVATTRRRSRRRRHDRSGHPAARIEA